MAKVYGIHRLEVQPGATEQAIHQLAADMARTTAIPGYVARIVKADRGERVGEYAMIVEMDSVATRDRYFPPTGDAPSDEFDRLLAPYQAQLEQLFALLTFPDPHFSDYVVVGE